MSRLGAWFARRSPDDDLADEIRSHVDEKTDELIARGMSHADARAAALRAFGNVGRIRETGHEVWRWPAAESVWLDVRFALRLLRRQPGFSANVILIAMLGVAACATTFSLVSGILLSPLPFSDPERVYMLGLRSAEGATTVAIAPDGYHRIAADTSLVEAIASTVPNGATVTWNDEPERWDTERITASFFRAWGVAPILGRAFSTEEGTHEAPVALLGHRNWRTRYRADSSVLGRTIVLTNVAHTIVGVMPPGFRAHFHDEPDVWVPMRVSTTRDLNPVLRLRAGVTPERAEDALARASEWTVESRTRRGERVVATPELIPITEQIVGEARVPLRILLGAVVLVVLLVSANVATMFLARSSARDRELGVRRAVGASVARQARQLITEAVVLTGIGGIAGVIASYWLIALIRDMGTRILPRMDAVALDWRVAVFVALTTIAMGVAGGLAPALLARRDTVVDASAARVTGTRTSSTLVVAQVMLSVVLAVGAGLLVKSFLGIVPTDPGFDATNRAMIAVQLGNRAEFATAAQRRQFLADVSERMRRVPGVINVGATTFAPMSGVVSRYDVDLPDAPAPERPRRAYQNIVSANLTELMRIRLVHGRAFAESDVDGAPRVAIVNETAAALWWPGQNPVGHRIVLPEREHVELTVVGVMADMRFSGRDRRARAEMFVPAAQDNPGYITFVVHSRSDPAALTTQLKRAVWSVAPSLHLSVDNLQSIVLDTVRTPRFYAWALGLFALAAVLLSGLGVYGLLAFAVAQRRRELGIRLALGATPARVGLSVLRRALILGTTGAALGLAAAFALTRFLESQLIEVTATDPTVFALAAVAVIAIAVAAGCSPAYQALRVDPIKSLRVS